MKTLLLSFLLLLSVGNLWGQKYSFGVKAGVQFPRYSSMPIMGEIARLSFNAPNTIRPQLGLFYRHQLTDHLSLELAPSFFQETYDNEFLGIQNKNFLFGKNQIQSTLLYLPVLLSIDLGHQLLLSIGGGSNFHLRRIKGAVEIIDGSPDTGTFAEEEGIFDDIFRNINKWPINAEAGISYGFGRIIINGKFVYRISNIYESVTLEGQNVPLDFKTNYLQVEIGYQLGKSKKIKYQHQHL